MVHFATLSGGGLRHAPSILSFVPLLEVVAVALQPHGRPALAALVRKGGHDMVVCSVHLQAYEELADMRLRRAQLQSLVAALRRLGQDGGCSPRMAQAAQRQRRVLVLGDFNFHLPAETAGIYELGFADCWRALHGASDAAEAQGVTWEGAASPYLLFDDRRMRLDRVMLDQAAHGVAVADVRLFGNQPLQGCWRTFPSDHYGIKTTLRLSHAAQPPLPALVASSQEMHSPFSTGYRTMSEIMFIRIMAVIFFVTVLSCIIAYLIML